MDLSATNLIQYPSQHHSQSDTDKAISDCFHLLLKTQQLFPCHNVKAKSLYIL